MSQKEIRHFFTIRNAESVNGEMFLEGISDPGAPNKRGLMLDAETSWPYIEAYVKEFEERTGGASKGALRAMHDERREVGKVVDVDLSQSPAIPVRVHVVSEEAKRFVEERVLNAFSWNWAVVGQMWEDKAASKQFGRKVMKYTGRPIELSLVDAPGIPDTGFNVVTNFDEGEEMSQPEENPATEPVTEPAPAPVEPDVIANSDPQPETVANGLYLAGRLGEHVEGLKSVLSSMSAEEAFEGQSNALPAELQEAVAQVATVYAKYAVAQVAELVGEGDDDDLVGIYEDLEAAFADDLSDESEIENGDHPGHPFRGNQHAKGGGKRTASHSASGHAARVSAMANRKGNSASHHTAAANAHAKAAKAAKAEGKHGLAKHHEGKAAKHSTLASVHGTKVGNSDTAPIAESSAVLSALSALSARFDALEAKVTNADRAPVAPVAPAPAKPKPVAVFHDPEQSGATVRNSDIPEGASLLERAAILNKSI